MAGKWWGEAEGVGRRPSPYTHDRPMMITMVMPEHRNTGTPGHRNTGTPEHRLLLRKPLRGLVRGAAATAALASAGARRLLVRGLLCGVRRRRRLVRGVWRRLVRGVRHRLVRGPPPRAVEEVTASSSSVFSPVCSLHPVCASCA